jgi:hypothetical protein
MCELLRQIGCGLCSQPNDVFIPLIHHNSIAKVLRQRIGNKTSTSFCCPSDEKGGSISVGWNKENGTEQTGKAHLGEGNNCEK